MKKTLSKREISELNKDGFSAVSEDVTGFEFANIIKNKYVVIKLSNGGMIALSPGDKFDIKTFADVVAVKFQPTAFDSQNGEAQDDHTEELLSHPLYPIFMAAIHQAIYGKGERHGGGLTPFMEQSWLHLAKKHGNGFLTGQACKKIEEAAETRTGEAFDTEVLGAINYTGMAIIHRRSCEGRDE